MPQPRNTGSQAREPLPTLLENVSSIANSIRRSHGFTSTDALGSFQHSWLAAAMVSLARNMSKLGPLLMELEENVQRSTSPDRRPVQPPAPPPIASGHLPAVKHAVARVRDILQDLSDISALRASLRADKICSDLSDAAANLRSALQPLTEQPAIDGCLTEEMREDAAHYVFQLQRFAVQVDESTTKLVADMQREVETSSSCGSPETESSASLPYNKRLCSIMQQVGLLMIDDPAEEAALLRGDAEVMAGTGDQAKAKLMLETAAVLDAQAAATECRIPPAATVNTANNASLMASLMATSSNANVLATCQNIGGGGEEGLAEDDPLALGEAPVTMSSPIGAERMSLQLSRRSSLFNVDDDGQVSWTPSEVDNARPTPNTPNCTLDRNNVLLQAVRMVIAEQGDSCAGSMLQSPASVSRRVSQEATPNVDEKALSEDAAANIPAEFICPISLELMTDPIVLETGQSYDRPSIQAWFRQGRLTCPKTGVKLHRPVLVPNHSLRSTIHDWAEANGLQQLLVRSSPTQDQGDTCPEASCDEAAAPPAAPVPRFGAASVEPLIRILRTGSEDAQESAARVVSTLTESDETRRCIAREGAIPLLVKLMRSADAESARSAAAAALANLAMMPENKSLIAQEQGSIDAMVALVRSGANIAKDAGARALLELAINSENRLRIAQGGGIPPLVGMLSTNSITSQEVAACTVWYLSVDSDNKRAIAQAGGIMPLLSLLCAPPAPTLTQEASAKALWNLAVDDANKVAIARTGGIMPLVGVLREGVGATREAAAGALMELAFNDNNKVLIATCGGIEPLLTLLETGDESAAETAAGALCNLATTEDNRIIITSSPHGIPALVAMCRSSNTACQEAAAKVLWNLGVNDTSKEAIKDAGGIPSLVSVLNCSSQGAKEAAAGALCNLALANPYKLQIASSGVMPPLVQMLSATSSSQVEAAAKLLWRLSEANENAGPIMWSGGLVQMLHVLGPVNNRRHPSYAVSEAVIRALACLVMASEEAAGVIIRTGGPARLVEQLRIGGPEGLLEACVAGLAALLAVDESANDTVVASGGILVLKGLLSPPASMRLREAAVSAVLGLALVDRNRQAIAWAGGIPPLVTLLQTGNPRSKEAAAQALWSLAVSDKNKTAISEAGCIPLLVAMLDGSDSCSDSGREAAAKCLWNLAVLPSNKVAIASAGGLAPLVAMLKASSHDNTPAQESAAGALLELLLHDANRRAVAQLGAISPLVKLLQSSKRPEMKEAVAGAICNLTADDDGNKEAVAKAGGVEALLSLLRVPASGQSGGGICEAAAKALWNLAQSQLVKIRLEQAKGIPPLVALLKSPSAAEAEAAAGALGLLAESDPLKAVILDSGEAIPYMVKLLLHKLPNVRDTAVFSLWNICALEQKAQQAFVVAGGLQAVVNYLSRNTPTSAAGGEAAAKILWSLAAQAELRDRIVQEEAIVPLIQMLGGSSGSSASQEVAAKCIWNLAASGDDIRRKLVDAEATRFLIRLLISGTRQCKNAASGAILELAFDERSRLLVCESGGVAPLIEILRTGTSEGKEAAAGALCNLSISPRVRTAIVRANGIQPLVSLVQGGSSGAKHAAAKALWNLSLLDSHKRIIGQAGAIRPLMILRSNGDAATRDAAAGALMSLSQDERNHAEISACGGLPYVTSLSLRKQQSSATVK